MWLLVSYNRPAMLRRIMGYLDGKPAALWDNTGNNIGLIAGLNKLVAMYPNERWYGLLADDLIPETEGWDAKLLHALPSGGMVSCNDGGAPFLTGRMCGACAIDGDTVRAAGFIAPPPCWHSFTDDFWEACAADGMPWARLKDVIVRHETPVGNYRPADETHEKAYGKNYEILEDDRAKYNAWMAVEGRNAKRRVIDNAKASWWKHAVA